MIRFLILVVALSAGGIAAWLALSMQPRAIPATVVVEAAPVAPKTEILVAAGDLKQGQKLQDSNLRWQVWPDGAMNPGFITRASRPDALPELSGSVVRSHFVAGEPIREEKLARADSGFLAAMLPSGQRAVAIRVSAESAAGGFILPNDRVDVIRTIVGDGHAQSQVILGNIRVLAIDQKADETKGEAAVIGKTATLELSPEQAEILSGAQAVGVLSLALRSVADGDEEPRVQRRASDSIRILRAGRSEYVKIQ
jgi:pilus assembly protein CpaB